MSPVPHFSQLVPHHNDRRLTTRELLRKGLHLIVAAFPFFMLEIGRTNSLTILIPATITAFAAEYGRAHSSRLEQAITLLFGSMMRPSEHAADGKYAITGATWVLASLTIMTLAFDLTVAAASFVMFMVGDAAAALVGNQFGTHQWRWSPRTFEGSAAFLVFAIGAGLLFDDLTWTSLAVTSVVGAVMESLPGPFNDNVRVPISMALVLSIIIIMT